MSNTKASRQCFHYIEATNKKLTTNCMNSYIMTTVFTQIDLIIFNHLQNTRTTF